MAVGVMRGVERDRKKGMRQERERVGEECCRKRERENKGER